jgi:hypothetical protein
MNHIIQRELSSIVEFTENTTNGTIFEDKAFSMFIIQYFYFNGMPIDKCYTDIYEMITDGANDGGIDFVFYDDENDKIILGQSKYRESVSPEDVITELNKMSNTVQNFIDKNTGTYNPLVRNQLQNALDRLPEENTGNIEYCIFAATQINSESIQRKISSQHSSYSIDMISLYQEEDIVERVNEALQKIKLVKEQSVSIDRAKNYLEYSSKNSEGIIVNLSSKSLITMFNKYADEGLFDLNIRKYINNRTVDEGIRHTLANDRQNFWFLNNGLIVACKDYYVDGNTVKLFDFSIVNGGQTTNIIGKFKGNNEEEFFIPCKIIKEKYGKGSENFYNRIAEATNSQKPILPRDLKSNSPEMRKLKRWLKKNDIELEIKRGDSSGLKSPRYKIKNDELGQFILSFVFQKPGTSRSGKKRIFDNGDLYNQVFRVNYEDDTNKSEFIISAIDLIYRSNKIFSELKKSKEIKPEEKEILKNGTQIIFALLGVVYRLANHDIDKYELIQDPLTVKMQNKFEYRAILNKKHDNVDNYLKSVIIDIIRILTGKYKQDSKYNPSITSVSNYFKTDNKYYELIIPGFVDHLDYSVGEDILEKVYIFRQSE